MLFSVGWQMTWIWIITACCRLKFTVDLTAAWKWSQNRHFFRIRYTALLLYYNAYLLQIRKSFIWLCQKILLTNSSEMVHTLKDFTSINLVQLISLMFCLGCRARARPPLTLTTPPLPRTNSCTVPDSSFSDFISPYRFQYWYFVSPWPSCLKRWLGSLAYVPLRVRSSTPGHGTHWHGPTQPTTWA